MPVKAPSSHSDGLLADLLAVDQSPVRTGRSGASSADMTTPHSPSVEITPTTAEVVMNSDPGELAPGAEDVLLSNGLAPEDWEVTGFRRSEWDAPNGDKRESLRFNFARKKGRKSSRPALTDAELDLLRQPKGVAERPAGPAGYLVFLGDMQAGKMDGDGPAGTLRRTLDCLDQAASKLIAAQEQGWPIGHIHVGWLGDHIEGFESQGGANVWRTPMTLSEQIRFVRRVMIYALTLFAPLAERVTFAAVPGNHGETKRFAGKGITRYDDSHDTEALVAVADAATLNPEAFGHCHFFVPGEDEMAVYGHVAGLDFIQVHGHQWQPGRHKEWWQKQAFGRGGMWEAASLLVGGHLHHLHLEGLGGGRLYLGLPALEAQSTWWLHKQGEGGSPGIVTALVSQGSIVHFGLISADAEFQDAETDSGTVGVAV